MLSVLKFPEIVDKLTPFIGPTLFLFALALIIAGGLIACMVFNGKEFGWGTFYYKAKNGRGK